MTPFNCLIYGKIVVKNSNFVADGTFLSERLTVNNTL